MLEISVIKEKQMDEIESEALKVMLSVLKDERDWDEVSSAAMKTMGVIAKNRQTMTAREGIRFNMAASLSDPNALKKYVVATQPEIRKCLAEKKGN